MNKVSIGLIKLLLVLSGIKKQTNFSKRG